MSVTNIQLLHIAPENPAQDGCYILMDYLLLRIRNVLFHFAILILAFANERLTFAYKDDIIIVNDVECSVSLLYIDLSKMYLPLFCHDFAVIFLLEADKGRLFYE